MIDDVGIPMVCLCDIPLQNSYSQRKFFGMYGIALKKDWAISNWITPVIYVAENTKNNQTLPIRFHDKSAKPQVLTSHSQRTGKRFLCQFLLRYCKQGNTSNIIKTN